MAEGEGETSPSLEPWAEGGRSPKECTEALSELRGGRGSGFPGWDWKGCLKEDGGGRRRRIESSPGVSEKGDSAEGDLRNFLRLVKLGGFDKVGDWRAGMGVAGKRSRSGSECSELEERDVEDQEERLADVIKGGRGGAKEA